MAVPTDCSPAGRAPEAWRIREDNPAHPVPYRPMCRRETQHDGFAVSGRAPPRQGTPAAMARRGGRRASSRSCAQPGN